MSEDPRELSPYRVLRDPAPPADFRPAGEGFAEEEAHLRDYWRVLMKHRRIALSIFLVVVATTAIVTFTMDPRYTATATIQIERQAPKFAPVQEVQQIDTTAGFDKYDYYQTQYEILESRTIAARVIKALALESDRRFTEDPAAEGILARTFDYIPLLAARGDSGAAREELGVEPRRIDEYLRRLTIDPVRNSRLVNVAFTTKHRDLSAEVANRHVEEYVNASLEQRLGMTLKAKEFLEKELAKSKDRVVSAEVALNKFRKENGIVSLDGGKSDIVSERLGDLNERFTEAEADRIRLEGQYRLIQRRSYESLPDVVSSELVSQLKQEVSRIEAERAELARRFKPGYPKMQEVVAREEQAKERLDAEIGKIVAGIESAYLAAKNREVEIGKQLERQRLAALDQKDVSADYDTLKRDVDTARGLYANLLQRLKDVDVAEEIKVSNVSVVDAAAEPLFPSRPRKRLNLILASVIGLMLGIGMAFFLEYLDNTLKTPEDVERHLGLPTLGVVPSFETPALAYGGYGYGYGSRPKKSDEASRPAAGSGRPNGKSTDLVVSAYPLSIISEAYRTIRTGILLSSADNPPQVILITSGSAGEGKTVTAVNQAMTLVQTGGRVLLVDADIRKPRLHRIFEVPNGHGLSTWLAGQSGLDHVIHEVSGNGRDGNGEAATGTAVGRLFVLPSGPLPPNPAELLGSQRMRETLATLRQRFDYIVLDTPPVLPVTDAVLLATMSDGVVLVVRGQETPSEVAVKSRDRLKYVRAKILGVVLNDVDVTSGDYTEYKRYYYSYHHEASDFSS